MHTNGTNFHIEVASSLDGAREVLQTELTTIADWGADGSFWGVVQVNANFIHWQELAVMSPDGVTHLLTDTPDIHEGVPRLSPDGTRLAFVSYTDADLSTYKIEVMNVDGTGRRTVATTPGASWPVWSPDGTRLLFLWASVPRLVNVATRNTYDLVEELWDMKEGFDWAPLPGTVTPAGPAAFSAAEDGGVRSLALPDPSTIAAGSLTASSIWPQRDGYRYSSTVRLRMKEPARSRVDIYNSAGTRVRAVAFGWRTGLFTWKWTGRSSSGSILSAGRYRIVMLAKDLHGNELRTTFYARLYRGSP